MSAFPARIVPLPAQVSETSLTLPDDLSYDEWVSYGEGFARMAHAAMWWLGDWWAFGNQHYGERAKAAAASDRAFQTCMDAGWVARRSKSLAGERFSPSGYHREVAGLDAPDQECFLNAGRNRDCNARPTPRHIIRAEIKAFKRQRDRPQLDPPTTPYQIWAHSMSFTPTRPGNTNSAPTAGPSKTITPQWARSHLRPAAPVCDDAILFLWATMPQIAEALDVIDAWDFNTVPAWYG